MNYFNNFLLYQRILISIVLPNISLNFYETNLITILVLFYHLLILLSQGFSKYYQFITIYKLSWWYISLFKLTRERFGFDKMLIFNQHC